MTDGSGDTGNNASGNVKAGPATWWSDATNDPWRDPRSDMVIVSAPTVPAAAPPSEPEPEAFRSRRGIGLVATVAVVSGLLAGALPAAAQTFKVQCPQKTTMHPNGDAVDAAHPGLIKCQQISGGDGTVYAARNVLAQLKGKPTKPFRYRDYGQLATIGRNAAVAMIGRLHLSGFPAWLVWLVAHIYFLINFRSRIMVMFDLTWAYWTSQRSARIVFFKPPASPR